MKTRMYFTHRIDLWDDAGERRPGQCVPRLQHESSGTHRADCKNNGKKCVSKNASESPHTANGSTAGRLFVCYLMPQIRA